MLLSRITMLLCFWHATFCERIQEVLHCSFDSDFCGFVQDTGDRFNWTRQQDHTPTFNTGPLCDPIQCYHGSYVFIESSYPRSIGDRARLLTPIVGGSGTRCLSFYYHMFGSGIGTLTVRLASVLSQTTPLLWEASGDQGDQWHTQHVDFSVGDAYQIIFDATVGPSYTGDIAIDNVEITLGSCSSRINIDCDFEHDMCGWTISPVPGQTFPVNWARHYGETDTPNTGPSSDRRSHAGYYIYVESSRTITGDLARLQSPVIPSSASIAASSSSSSISSSSSSSSLSSPSNGSAAGLCLTFWHHQYGEQSGNLTVLIESEGGDQFELMWRVGGPLENAWVHRAVNLNSRLMSRSFRIVFEAALAGSTGDIAIDDISLQNSSCSS